MNILILSRIPSIYSTQRLVQEVISLGHQAHVENPEATDLHADIIIPRIGNFRYEEAIKNLEALQKNNHARMILNPMPYFHRARHKKMALEILKELPQPRLYDKVESFPVVVKDVLSSQGEGVFLCKNQEELTNCLRKLQGRELLFQEFIAESQGTDIRVFVVGNKVVACMERRSADPLKEFRSNISLGGTGKPTSISPAEEELCLTAVKRLGLDYAGVDFIKSSRGGLILEVNPCPGLEGIEKWTLKNIAKEIILYAVQCVHSANSY